MDKFPDEIEVQIKWASILSVLLLLSIWNSEKMSTKSSIGSCNGRRPNPEGQHFTGECPPRGAGAQYLSYLIWHSKALGRCIRSKVTEIELGYCYGMSTTKATVEPAEPKWQAFSFFLTIHFIFYESIKLIYILKLCLHIFICYASSSHQSFHIFSFWNVENISFFQHHVCHHSKLNLL